MLTGRLELKLCTQQSYRPLHHQILKKLSKNSYWEDDVINLCIITRYWFEPFLKSERENFLCYFFFDGIYQFKITTSAAGSEAMYLSVECFPIKPTTSTQTQQTITRPDSNNLMESWMNWRLGLDTSDNILYWFGPTAL